MRQLCYSTFLLGIYVILGINRSTAIDRYWIPDSEWTTLENWMDNRLPETKQRVRFPLETGRAVGIGKSANWSLAGIELARSGSLVLARNGELEIFNTESSTRTSLWKKEGRLFWADPENWNGTAIAAPDLERVPCRQHDVVLPSTERTFSVQLPISNVQIRSIRTADQKFPLTSWEWTAMGNKREFARGRFTVKYSDYNCETCPCHETDFLEEVCAIQRPRCGFPGCEYPLTVQGNCWRYCGGRLSISSTTSLSQVRVLVNEALEGYERKVSWHARRKYNGNTEVLVKGVSVYSDIDVAEAVEVAKAALLGAGVGVLSTETANAAVQDSRWAVTLSPLLGAPHRRVPVPLGLSLLWIQYFVITRSPRVNIRSPR